MISLTLNRGAGYALYRQLVWIHTLVKTEDAVPQEDSILGEYKMILTVTQTQFDQCRVWLDKYPERFENAAVVRKMFGNSQP